MSLCSKGSGKLFQGCNEGGTQAGLDFQKVALAADDVGGGRACGRGPDQGFALVQGTQWGGEGSFETILELELLKLADRLRPCGRNAKGGSRSWPGPSAHRTRYSEREPQQKTEA